MKVLLTTLLFASSLVLMSACGNGAAGVDKAAPAVSPEAVTADPAHYAVLFENDAARLLRIKYAPGDKSVMHNHPASCAVFLLDSTFKMTAPSGEAQTSNNTAGQVSCGDAEVHLPENAGAKPAEVVLIEFKNRKTFDNIQTGKSIAVSSAPKVPDAIASDPALYSVQFENDAVRVLRIKFGAADKAHMHAHPANCSIEMTGGTTKDGDGKPEESKPGEAGCGDAQAHAPENVGKQPFETILVEFKNMEKFKS